jgi:hypothetical protein
MALVAQVSVAAALIVEALIAEALIAEALITVASLGLSTDVIVPSSAFPIFVSAFDHSELRVGQVNCQHLGVSPVFAPSKADHSVSNKILVTLVSR